MNRSIEQKKNVNSLEQKEFEEVFGEPKKQLKRVKNPVFKLVVIGVAAISFGVQLAEFQKKNSSLPQVSEHRYTYEDDYDEKQMKRCVAEKTRILPEGTERWSIRSACETGKFIGY